jgi:hypothetical protein
MWTDCPAPDGSQTAYSGELIGFTMRLQCGENTPEGNTLITFTSRDVTGEFIGTSRVTEHVAGMVICEGAVELPGLDTDFDGIPDLSDSCPTIPNTGIDRDNDGIDDACDTSAPVTPGQPPKGPIVITPPGQPLCTGPGCRG